MRLPTDLEMLSKFVVFEEYELKGECLAYDLEMESWFYKGWKTFSEVVRLFKIPSEDAIILKLQYGD